MPLAPVASAQTLSPVVDVCTGVSIDQSTVTDLLVAVNQPIVSPIEATVNGILTLIDPLIILPLPSPLAIDVTGIVDNAVAGNPIAVQVLDTDGNIVAPGDCNIAADGLTLNTEQGISIGGNSITGLGANGQQATAAELDAIAFGNNASTSAGAFGAIAIGTDATATAANSVALGAGSIADRGAMTGYVAPGLAGTFDSAGSVSVGAPGAERQITNVAPGTALTDAATVGQVLGAVATANANNVQYDDASHATVTLDGAGGTTLTGLAPGVLDPASTDAVNGSQLFATNEAVAQNTADITVNTAGIAQNTADIAQNTADIAQNTTDIATNTGDIAALQATAVQYDDATQTSITLGGAGGTTISNLAAGELSATSTEAVNGSQLFATNQAVAQNTTDIANLDGRVTVIEGDVANLDGRVTVVEGELASLQTGITNIDGRVTTNETNIANLDGRVTVVEGDVANLDGRVTVVEGDVANLDARVTVNEGDIANLDGRVTVNEGDIANLDGRVTVNEGDIANLDGRVTVNEGDIANLDARVTVNEGDIASLETNVVNLDGRVTVNEGDIAVLQAQVANVPVRYVSDADRTTPSATPTDTVALVSASGGAATLTNVGAGELSATSTDAVNGSQLFATNQAVAQNTADIVTINNNLAGSTVVAVQYSNPDNPTVSNGGTITNDVTLVGANSAAPVRLHNVAAGTLANDAVNLGQMQSALAATLSGANSYTDARIAELRFDLSDLDNRVNRLRDDAFAGTAAAMAVASIPQTIEAGRSMFGGGVGHYRGETAFAIGASTALNDGRAVLKAGATLDTNGKGGFSAGAGFSF